MNPTSTKDGLDSESSDAIAVEVTRLLASDDIQAAISKAGTSGRKLIGLILGRLPPCHGIDLVRRIDLVQALLVQEGLIKEPTHAGFRPPPQRLHSRENLHSSLDLHSRIIKAIDTLDGKSFAEESDLILSGLLITLLAIECGAHSESEIKSAIAVIRSAGIKKMNSLYYVVLPHIGSGGLLSDARRLFLSPATVATALLCSHKSLETSADSLSASISQFASHTGLSDLTLDSLITAASCHFEFSKSPPRWLIYWMTNNHILSSSLVEETFSRINGFVPESSNFAKFNDTPDIAPENFTDIDTEDAPFDNPDVLTRVNSILRDTKNITEAKRLITNLQPEFEIISERHPAAIQLFGWVLQLCHSKMATSSIRRLWTAIAKRLLALTPERPLDDLSQDQWEQLFSAIADSSLSASTRSITAQALNNLIGFLNQGYGSEIHRLPSGKQVSIANARIITPRELGACTRYLGSVYTLLTPPFRKSAISLTNLAWKTGLRRNEAFHLRASDIAGIKLPIIKIRDSAANPLKSASSNRDIPLGLFGCIPEHISGHTPIDLLRDGDCLLIQESGSQTTTVAPNSADHHALIRRMVDGVHDALRSVTGDEEAVLHILRHSCATYYLIALLGDRFGLDALMNELPFLKDALDSSFAAQVKELILPPCYEGCSELEIVRDLLGHASELTTLAHYVHCLDVFRLGLLRPEWITSYNAIGHMIGLPRSTTGRASNPDELITIASNRSNVKIHVAQLAPADTREETQDAAGTLLRGLFAALSVKLEPPSAQSMDRLSTLKSLGITPADNGYVSRREHIEPLAIDFFAVSKRPTSLAELLPIETSVQTAAFSCQYLLRALSLQTDNRSFMSTLARDCHFVLSSRTRASTSTIAIHSANDLRAVRNVVSALTADLTSAITYKLRQVTDKDRLIEIDSKAADAFFDEPSNAKRTMYVSMKFGKEENERGDTSTFVWMLSAIYVLCG